MVLVVLWYDGAYTMNGKDANEIWSKMLGQISELTLSLSGSAALDFMIPAFNFYKRQGESEKRQASN